MYSFQLANHPNVMGFDPMINQRLLPPTFPRYTKIKPRIEALEYLDDLINRFKTVTRIINYTSFHGALVREKFKNCKFIFEEISFYCV